MGVPGERVQPAFVSQELNSFPAPVPPEDHPLAAKDAAYCMAPYVLGPGEALVMTAAGLAVAIPAVLGYNIFGKRVAACEAELEGFAHDLREMVIDTAAQSA